MMSFSFSFVKKTFCFLLSLVLACGLLIAQAYGDPAPSDPGLQAQGKVIEASITDGPVNVVVTGANTAEVTYYEKSAIVSTAENIDLYTDEIIISGEGNPPVANSITITGNGESSAPLKITLNEASVDNSSSASGYAFALSDFAHVDLTLMGDNIVQSGQDRAGLEVPENCEISIQGSSSLDSLTAASGGNGAGIGGGLNQAAGTITIDSGTITATSSLTATKPYGAGIGGGKGQAGGRITINDGTVAARSGTTATASYGAGIGGGNEGSSGTIAINGGVVTAISNDYQWDPSVYSSSFGAGIGGGSGGSGQEITITGGTVTAYSGKINDEAHGAGIGGGDGGSAGDIAISGTADVTAVSAESSSAFAESYNAGIGGNSEGSIKISGEAVVEAISNRGGSLADGAGVGGGGKAATHAQGHELSIDIGEKAMVTASSVASRASGDLSFAGVANGAGIGGGIETRPYSDSIKTGIAISGAAQVDAVSSRGSGEANGAGIGGGKGGMNTVVAIEDNAEVTAYSSSFSSTNVDGGTANGAGIGGGYNNRNTTITIGHDDQAGEPTVRAASKNAYAYATAAAERDSHGAGIGAGRVELTAQDSGLNETSIIIHKGTVTAMSNCMSNDYPVGSSLAAAAYGAGIGSGRTLVPSGASNKAKTSILIGDATVTAIAMAGPVSHSKTNNAYGAGIGNGNLVIADSRDFANDNQTDITITGGVVESTGATNGNVIAGAGIGGGSEFSTAHSKGTITITGGYVTARGGSTAQDIGIGTDGMGPGGQIPYSPDWVLDLKGGSIWPAGMANYRTADPTGITGFINIDPAVGPYPTAIPLTTGIPYGDSSSEVPLNGGKKITIDLGGNKTYEAYTVTDAHEHGESFEKEDTRPYEQKYAYAAWMWLPATAPGAYYKAEVDTFAGGQISSKAGWYPGYLNEGGSATSDKTSNMLFFREVPKDEWGIGAIADVMYTGQAHTPIPEFQWRDGSGTLIDSSNFSYAYINNTDAGKATVRATGKNNFAGTNEVSFNIVPVDINSAQITGVDQSYPYTSEAITPVPEVRYQGRLLVEGTDYELAYRDNVNPGTASLTVAGLGNFAGTYKVTFAIVPSNIPTPADPDVPTDLQPLPVGGKSELANTGDSAPYLPLAGLSLALLGLTVCASRKTRED